MITGTVTALREATINVALRGTEGTERQIDAVIDTGYNGALSLPLELVEELQLPWTARGRGLLADGREAIFHSYEATVVWDGRPRRISADAAEVEPLVGMALLEGYERVMQVMAGGNVTIRPL